MSTPTPSSASKKAIGTPSHHLTSYSSPVPPRSHPSPNAVRSQQAGKTPINHATGSSQGSKTMGGTPMMLSLSQQGHASANTVGSSPGTNLGGFGTPIGLGVEGITPSVATPMIGGVAMMPTMSELGLTVGSGKRNEDDDRRVKMRQVLKRIGRRTARVSEEGIVRVSRRVGFQTNLDDEKESPSLQRAGNRTFTIAGKKILVDVKMLQQRPSKVDFMFASENAFLAQEQGPAVGKVLMKDLECAEGSLLAPTLDRFAANLERLARLDRVNSDHLDCFEALGGLHESFARLFEQEKKSATETEVLCSKSGRPEVHADGELGLSLAYWQDPRTGSQEDGDANAPAVDGIFRLRLEVEASSASLYPPIRVSNTWLPDPLTLPDADSTHDVPWQDPPPTTLPSTQNADPLAIDSRTRLPDLRFVATLDPPLIMEHYTALNLLSTFGIVPPAPITMPPHYHVMLLAPGVETSTSSPSAPILTSLLPVLTSTTASASLHEPQQQHINTLDPAKQEFGFRLTHLPFSHPRQLVNALPTLRQWALFSTLLRSAFPSPQTTRSSSTDWTRHAVPTPPATPPLSPAYPVRYSISVTPTPTLVVVFPGEGLRGVRTKVVRVLAGARVEVDEDEAEGKGQGQGRMTARALEQCADLGVWVEWMRVRGRKARIGEAGDSYM